MFDSYQIIETLYSRRSTEVFRAIRKTDGASVVLKAGAETGSFERETGLAHEFELGKSLAGERSVRYLAIKHAGAASLLEIEDDHMDSLESKIPRRGFDSPRFFNLAAEMAAAIEEVHAQGVIHKDVNPANIIVNPALDAVKLIDFGLATRISEEIVGFEAPAVMRGTLIYISPEQTGRINRPVDSRSDLYSLGASLHRLITGRPPFETTNPGELIYSHIARTPTPVSEIRRDIPREASLVIEKLLKKSPDERYQTASGVKNDLLYLQKAIAGGKKIVDFTPGRNEQTRRIILSDKLYGREEEIARLLVCFSKSAEAGRVVEATGPAGIGKTALIRELYTPITTQKGFFLSGKFDQLNKGLAYTALADALKDFVHQCLGQDPETMEVLKNAVRASTGEFGQVLTDMAPEFRDLIGPQPNIAAVSPLETADRRNTVFSNLIKDICAVGRPLVIFLDDLQWADSATLSLLETIIRINPTNLLILLSYRDNEISPAHPTKLFLDNVKNSGVEFTSIHLDSLNERAVNDWMNDILPDAGPGARELAARVMAKTEGNPFYITSFLHLIIDKNYIKREADGAVTLDMEAVANIPADADVAAHLIRKIESLDPGSREFLTRASILGARFTLDAVDLFLGEKHAGRRDAIQTLVGVHLLVKSGENILFAHDRVQQAARAMLDDDEARALHLRAGQNIQAALDARGATSERMEDYLYHYNAAADLITDEGRRSELAGLNLALGKRLKNNAAYQAAESAFTRAIAFLPQNPFDADYDMAMELFTECGETLFLNLKYDEGEKRFETVLAHSKSPLDSATVYVKQINHFAAHHDLEKSMKIALSALEKLGVKLPLKLLKLSIVKDLLIVMRLLKNKKPEDVLHFPVTDDPLILARMEVLSAASPTAYIGYPDYLPLIILRMMIISITRGNSRISPYAYAAYAMLLCCLGWMESGYAFGRAALALMEKLDVKRLFSKVPYLFGFFVNHWKKPVRDGIAFYERAVAHGLETGDYEYASYAANYVMLYSFYYVESIDGLLARYPEQHRILAGFNKDHAVFLAKYWHQLLIVMNTPSGDGVTISGEMIDGDSLISLLEEKKDLTSLGVCMLGKLQLAYLAGDFREAERIRPGVIALTKALIGTIFNPICHFFAALTCIAYYRSHKKDSSLLREAKRSLKKLRKWGKAAPDNFLYMAQLVEAEWLSVKKKKVEALERYEAAVENARKAGNNLVLGVAGECMGRYLATIGLKEISRECIRRSILVFQEWGALNKSSRLQEEHRMEISRESIARGSVSTCHTSRAFNIELDLEALVETIESLTGNLKFDSLLETLLDAIMRNSGATRAVYLHVEPESPRVKAEKLANSPVRIFEGRDALPASFDLPTAWLEKCLSGSSRHVLTNMEIDPDPGREERPESRMKSILIIPLIRHGAVRGLVYLENELIADAFREDQVQFLTLLAGQAAIAIENTLAFESLHAERDYSSDIIQNSPALICGIDGAGTTTFVNPVIEETTGYRKEELIGENWWELLHPGEEYEQVRRLFNAFARGEAVDHEMRVTRKNGERKIVIWNHVVKRDGRGGVVEIIGFGNDVTERKRAEEKLRRLRNHLTNIIDSMPSALVGVDLEGRVTRWNKTAERTTGVPASAARGKILSRVFPGMAPEMEKIAESIRTREAKQDRKRPRQTEDGARYEDVTIYPLIADEVEGAVIRIDDVTDKVRMEEMMIQSEKMLSVGGLAAGMAHEINNPLAGMMQTANVMASRLTDEKMPANLRAAKAAGISMEAVRGFMEARGVPNMVRTIYESGRRVAAIVDNMLSFARKSEERGAYHSLEELLDKTLELAAADYNLKKHHDFKLIEIKREYEGDLPPAFCEGGKIRQVLLNILRNGAQAMQEAGAEKPRFIIRTRSEEAREMVRMEIEDNGPGMDETTRKRVFEPFYTTKPEGVGTGLGLSVSYFIITENHGGEMAAESTPGQGTNFIIRLPVQENPR